MEQMLNNLRIIEKKILEAQKEGDYNAEYAWKGAAGTTCNALQQYFAHLGKPKTVMGQLIEDNINLPS